MSDGKGDYRSRLFGDGFFWRPDPKHGVMALNDGAVKCPGHALAHVQGRFFWNGLWHAVQLALVLHAGGNGLVGSGGHVKEHFAQMCAA